MELDVSGRALTSEGFLEVARALVKSIAYSGDHGRVVRLEEICLRQNKINARCLKALGEVVKSAAGDLRDLDLSDNFLTITTDEEVIAWEDFLTSFSRCCVLRRIDLTGNALGPRAFEVLTRVYGREPPVDLVSLEEADPSVHHDVSGIGIMLSDSVSLEQQIRASSIMSESDVYTDGDKATRAIPEESKRSRHGLFTSFSIRS